MRMKKILVIEDDPDIANLVRIHLEDHEYEVDHTMLGKTGLQWAKEKGYDLIVLDLRLPDMDGFEICRQLRSEKQYTPIVMLTARTEEIDKVLGLETGADDYITKPFSVREFLARIKAVLRRTGATSTEEISKVLQFDTLEIEIENRIVRIEGERIELTPKEFDLLALMAKYPGRSFSREKLLNIVWGYQFEGYEHTVNSHINRLRAKIESDQAAPRYILTTWGVGYRFTDEL